MGIHINLSPEIENYLKSKVDTGLYGNVTEVIRAAIRHFQERDDWIARQHQRFEYMIDQGKNDIQSGQFDVLTADKMDDIYNQSLENAFQNTPVNPDVLPASLLETYKKRTT